MIWDSDDFGSNHVISDMCQTHDCRDALIELKKSNPDFKATLFAVPGEMTPELLKWCALESGWIELAVHGFYHTSNYECEKMGLSEFGAYMQEFKPMLDEYFVKGFKAPGWQISDDCYDWLKAHDYWVADQSYNDSRRPVELPVYLNNNGVFGTMLFEKNNRDNTEGYYFHSISAIHTHTWNCMGNGVYELLDDMLEKLADKKFKFISEVV